jgi:hypothetical protein
MVCHGTVLCAPMCARRRCAGPLLDTFSQWTSLTLLIAKQSLLGGTLPSALASWTQLSELSIDSSQVSGEFERPPL